MENISSWLQTNNTVRINFLHILIHNSELILFIVLIWV